MVGKKVTIDVAAGPPKGTAALMRLSPGLKEALGKALKSGAKVSVKMGAQEGEANVILVNGKEFNFRSVPERSCTLFELPRGADKNGDGRKLANITEKIQVKRTLDAEEIYRMQKEKKSIVPARAKTVKLDEIPPKGGLCAIVGMTTKTVVTRIIRRPDPAPQKQTETMDTILSATGGGRPSLPKPASKVPKERPKSIDVLKPASKSKRATGPSSQLGITPARPTAEKVEISNEAAVHAASKDNAKMCILALLYEKPYSPKVIQQAVVECYQRTKEKRDRCPAKEYVIRTVQSVCDYCAHNKYALKPEFRLEVEKFIQENNVSMAKQAARPKPKKVNSKMQPVADAVAPANKVELIRSQKPSAQTNWPATQPRSRSTTQLTSPEETVAPPKPPERKLNINRLKRPLQVTPPREQSLLPSEGGSPTKIRKTGATNIGLSASPNKAPKADFSIDHPAPAIPSPVDIQQNDLMDMEVEESKPKIEAAPVEKKHIPPFLDHAALEESWFTEYTGREPQQTPKITSAEQFDQLQKEYADKYNVYMRLHKLINDNRTYFEGLTTQLSKGGSESDQDAVFQRLKADWTATGTVSLSWSHARSTLHEELKSCRERLEEFLATYEG